jgi:hypothetical protein
MPHPGLQKERFHAWNARRLSLDQAAPRRGLICSVSFLFSIVGNESHSAANADDLIE